MSDRIGGSGVSSSGQAYSLEGANMTPALEYRLIPLTNGQWAFVEVEDFEWLMQWKWSARWNKSTRTYYAIRNSAYISGEKRVTILMHREILGLQKGDMRKGDHANRDTLDNRRINLRIATQSENSMNSKMQDGNSSGCKGVSWNKKKQRWIAQIGHAGHNYHIGNFVSVEDASAAYREAALKLHGEFARTR